MVHNAAAKNATWKRVQGTGHRPIVDGSKCRLTLPNPVGQQWPVLFGLAATSVLIYVACNSGCRQYEISRYIYLEQPVLSEVIQRLQRIGLITRVPRRGRYRVNPELRGKRFLLPFLRAMGLAFGMPQSCRRVSNKNLQARARKLPCELFAGRRRTDVLVLIALLDEVYENELHLAMGVHSRIVAQALDTLIADGVIRRRNVRTVKPYSLNPLFPGAPHLWSLLREVGRQRSDLRAMVLRIYLRRAFREDHSSKAGLVNFMRSPKRSIHGVQKGAGRLVLARLRGGRAW